MLRRSLDISLPEDAPAVDAGGELPRFCVVIGCLTAAITMAPPARHERVRAACRSR